MPFRQDEHLLTHGLHLAEDVAGQDDRVRLAQLPNEVADLDDLRGVQPHGGLIQNDELRAAQQRLRNAHPLTVALGQAADDPGQHFFQPGAAGSFQHLFFALSLLFDALQFRCKIQIFLHGHLRVKRRLLGQVAHTGLGLLGFFRQAEARHLHLTLGGCQIAGEDIHNGGFARAVGPQQAVDLAVRHRKREILHSRAAAVGLAQVRNFDHSKLSFVSEAVLRKAAWTQRFPVWNCYSLDGKCV